MGMMELSNKVDTLDLRLKQQWFKGNQNGNG